MSLQRLVVLASLAGLVGACLTARVASEQSKIVLTAAQAATSAPSALQQPRVFDADLSARRVTAQAIAAAGLRLSTAVPTFPLSTTPVVSSTSEKTSSDPVAHDHAEAAKSLVSNAPNAVPLDKSNAKTISAKMSGDQTVFVKNRVRKIAVGSKNAESVRPRARKPEMWSPPTVFGPPLPPERIHVQKQAHQLNKDWEAGRLTLLMSERDGEQLRGLERDGIYGWPAPPDGVVVRSPHQHDVLEGTAEELSPSGSSAMQLASRGTLPQRLPTLNPADDPDFDPCALPPAPALLRLLTTLAGYSTPARPLEIMSLLRPPYRTGGYIHVGAANPHSLGLAVDISAYGGHPIRQAQPEECVAATLAILRDLPPGRYRLGMPKAPEGGWDLPRELEVLLQRAVPNSVQMSSEDEAVRDAKPSTTEETTGCLIAALYGLHVSSAKPAWPFFPPPYMEAVAEIATPSANASGSPDPLSPPTMVKTVLRFQNEAYAPEALLTDARLRKALEAARKRGVDVIAMFPDGADHIHIDVRQNP